MIRLELSAARSEYAAPRCAAEERHKRRRPGGRSNPEQRRSFRQNEYSENLREWFGENVLAPAVAKDFSDRKKFDQDMLEQVNSNIKTVERWNLAESEAHLSRYGAHVKFYKDNKNAAAVKEAEDRYKDLALNFSARPGNFSATRW
jgi:hypothetical protein